MPTVGIAAHKFILSSCSQFFSSIFETSPITNNGQFHIVLPPDLSHRAIQILVQYMYMGEATVSNDILSEVLKGGELLKIRGLCRTTSSVTSLPQQNRSEMMQTSNNATYNLISMPLSAGPTSVRYLVEQQSQTVSRGLTTSALPKSSPVIMKSTKPLSTLSVPSTVNIGKLTTSSAISVNKHVAIDPGEKCYTQETSTVLREEPPSTCNEIGCNGCTRMAETPSKIILQRESQSHGDTNSTMCTKQCPEYVQQTASDDCLDDTPSNIYEPEIHLSNLTTEHSESIHNYSVQDTLTYTSNLGHPTATVIREGEIQHLVSASSPPPPTTNTHQVVVHETPAPYVSIKEEPSEWTASTTSLHNLQKKTSGNTDFKGQKIKTEPPISTTSLNMEADACQTMSTNQSLAGNDFDSYFSCDICKKVCEDKASLLRHLETHAAAVPSTSGFSSSMAAETASVLPKSSYVPKKRRRISVIYINQS